MDKYEIDDIAFMGRSNHPKNSLPHGRFDLTVGNDHYDL